ncbi:tetraspanin-5-like isoform X2 [Amphiura filiformis]|uniref:tetraspanin-5-like isoform X2 n=1 Tax=Amphiura filiformis TaxID=82378 RepID=UPI003B211EFD
MAGKDRPPPYNPYPNDIPQPYSRASAQAAGSYHGAGPAGARAGGYPGGPPPPQANHQYQQHVQQQPYSGDPGYQHQSQYRGHSQGRSGGGGRGQGSARQRQPAGKTGSLARIQRTARRVKESSEISLCIKYSLFFANFVFWLAGILLIGIGIWAWYDRGVLGDVENLVSSPFVDPVWWFIVLGGIIFVMAAFGCIGALRENILLLRLYSIFLGLVLLIEIGGGVAIYLYKDEIETKFVDQLNDLAITGYRDNPDFQDLVDAIQTEFKCCGVTSPDDWDNNLYFNCSDSMRSRYKNPEACGVPFSCCIRNPNPQYTEHTEVIEHPNKESEVINTQCGYNVRSSSISDADRIARININGCIQAFKYWVQTNLVVVAIAAGIILLVEIFGLCFAMSLINDIKRQKAKWRR